MIFKTRTISGLDYEINELKSRAESSGKSLNKYIKDILLDLDFKNPVSELPAAPTANQKYVNITIGATEEELSKMTELAESSKKSFGRWALDKILR